MIKNGTNNASTVSTPTSGYSAPSPAPSAYEPSSRLPPTSNSAHPTIPPPASS